MRRVGRILYVLLSDYAYGRTRAYALCRIERVRAYGRRQRGDRRRVPLFLTLSVRARRKHGETKQDI